MAQRTKIDSNITGLRIAEEASLGVLPAAASQVWYPLEPNSYSEFGTKVTTVARNPINASRQRKKGVVTGQEASGGFVTDVTQTNLQRALQGFFFADAREKGNTAPMNSAATVLTAVSAGAKTYTAGAGMSIFKAGDLVLASGFNQAANNGLRRVTTASSTAPVVAETLTDETPPAAAALSHVGFQFGSGAVAVTQTGGSLPFITVSGKDLTEFGIIPGEWVFIGGDSAGLAFATAGNNGFARVRSVTATVMTFDKTADVMVTDAGTGKTIQLFFGRVIKNESTPTLIKRRSYHLERTLGNNNTTDATKEQAEYLVGSVPNEFTLTVPTQEKVTAEVSFVSLRGTTVDENISGANTLYSKVASVSAPTLVESDAFNTSSDVSRIKLSSVSSSNSCPTPLFAFVQEMTIMINNSVTGDKAVGVIGSFEMTAGQFEVGGKMTAYFADVAAVKAVQDNADITLDAHFVKANSGFSFDMPLLALGDGRPNVESDSPITLPLESSAATGAKVHPTLNHTLLCVFYDYLPTRADS